MPKEKKHFIHVVFIESNQRFFLETPQQQYWFWTTDEINEDELKSRVKIFFNKIDDLYRMIRNELLTIGEGIDFFHDLSENDVVNIEKDVLSGKDNVFDWLKSHAVDITNLKNLQNKLYKLEDEGMENPDLFILKPDTHVTLNEYFRKI